MFSLYQQYTKVNVLYYQIYLYCYKHTHGYIFKINKLYGIYYRLFGMINSEVAERETFLTNALHWSAVGSQEYKSGHPTLHQAVAQIFWKGI